MVKSLRDPRSRGLIYSIASLVKNPSVLFGIVLLICTLVKLNSLNSRELWLDETYSDLVANLSFANILRYCAGDVHPPLFYLLLRIWIQVIGDAQAQLRLFSVVVDFFSSVAMYLFAKRMLGNQLGAYAAALFVLSPAVFIYSMEVRMYMIMTLLVICILMVHWLIAIEKKEGRWLVIAYGALAALLFYVHYIDVFIVLGFFAHSLLASGFIRRHILRLFAAGMVTIVLISPGVPLLLHQLAGKTQLTRVVELSHHNPHALSFGTPVQYPDEPAGIAAIPKSMAAIAGFYPAQSIPLFLLCAIPLVLCLATIGFLAIGAGDEYCRLFLLLTLAVSAGMLLLHVYTTRYMVPLIPPLVLAIGSALKYWAAKPRMRSLGLALGASILCLYAAGFYRQAVKPHGHPWQDVVNAVQKDYRPGDIVIFNALYAQVPFDYFANSVSFHPTENGFPLSVYDWWSSQSFKGWGGPVIMNSDLDNYISNLSTSRPKTVWLVQYETSTYDPHSALLERLRKLGQATEVPLPFNPDNTRPIEAPPPSLIRISIN